MKPMLAKKFQDYKGKIQYPCFVQPKLNGVRMLAHCGELQSRDEHLWGKAVLRDIRRELEKVPDHYVLDGELYIHGWSLQQINSVASVNRTNDHKDADKLEYHVFDCLDINYLELTFEERWYELCNLRDSLWNTCKIKFVTASLVETEQQAEQLYWYYKHSCKFEGMMYRDRLAPYGLSYNCSNQENRWGCLLKRKDFLDVDCIIIDVQEGLGKYTGQVGSLVLVFPDNLKVFNAGSGLTDMQRVAYMDKPPIGFKARINYEMLSDTGVPLKPVIECVYD